MNHHPSPSEHMDVERRSSSPKRKKVRQKYAPKACVSCRRSKLKCSGDNPCQRCVDNGKRCFFSEDQTAAEALQNLSRPTPTLQAQASNASGNGNNASRRSILPRDDETERRASDASTRGMSIEARMARVEAMMEALMRDRGLTMTPAGSVEREDSGSEGFRGDTAFTGLPLDPINPVLAFMGQPSPFSQESSNPAQSTVEPPHLVQLGNRTMPFPNPAEYQQRLMSFFTDIHLSHPCIDEADFRSRSEHMLASPTIQSGESHFLALNYLIFACCDVLLNTKKIGSTKPVGWQWLELADDILDKKSLLSGNGDLTLIQCLLFQALYYTFVDVPGPAYNSIGLAARLVFQYSLHQQSTWTDITTRQAYERICLFWNVFVADRFISLTCGRPYTIHEADIQVELPNELFVRAMLPMQLDHEHDPRPFMNHYLHYVILWARYAGNTLDGRSLNRSTQDAIDAQIAQFLDHDLPELQIPYTHPSSGSDAPFKTTLIQMKTDFVLWGFRPIITSLQYDNDHATHFSHLAVCTINRMSSFSQDARRPFSFRHDITTSLANAVLVLCSLIVRDTASRNQSHIGAFRTATAMLNDLAYSQPYAKRVVTDFGAITRAVEGIMDGKDVPENVASLFPYQSASPHIRMPQIALANSGVGSISTTGNGDPGKAGEPGCGVLWL
ncbi:CaiA Acyl-CoA dehydrogenase [Pyrenophora tritici-repentis]|nr:CaiA Acyl-CoA dehydrogenase [Pyrenophora tritici-repentis]